MWNCKLIVGEYGILLRQQHKPLFTKRTDLRAGVNHGSQYRYVLETVPEAMEFSRNLRENRIIHVCMWKRGRVCGHETVGLLCWSSLTEAQADG